MNKWPILLMDCASDFWGKIDSQTAGVYYA